MSLATFHRDRPWTIVSRSSYGTRPALAHKQVGPSWSPSVCSKNAGKLLRRGITAGHIVLTNLRIQSSGRRAVVTVRSAQGTQMVACPKLILSTCSRNSARSSRGECPVFSVPSRGGAVAINGIKSGGEADGEGHHETTQEIGNTRPGSRHLGRRAAMLLGGSTFWSGLGCCRICEEAAAAQDWDYGGPCGPAKWEGMCTSGSKQSPVDITSSNTKDGGSLGVLNFVYAPSTVSVKNTGHGTIQVSFGKANNFLRVRGQTLQLLQFHFHAPSEHAFDGKRYPMEAHLNGAGVYGILIQPTWAKVEALNEVKSDPISRKIAVVGVMLDASKIALPNKCLAASLAFVPQEHGLSVDAPIKVSPSFLLPSIPKDGSRGYVHYGGSLTTPPCSEGVEWLVLDTPLKINSSQVVDFMHYSGDGHSLAFNSRPLQLLGNRFIFKGP